MGILDFLKRKKEIQKSRDSQPEKPLAVPTAKQSRIHDSKAIGTKEKETKKYKAKEQSPRKVRKENFSYDIVKDPHISEKSTILGENNKYTFKIDKFANKQEVKRSIEGIYGVDVLGVNVINIPKKKRRLGRTEGFKKGYRKAVVTVKEGQKIEIL